MGKIHDALLKSDNERKSPALTKKASTYKVYDRKEKEKKSSDVIRTVFKSRDPDKKLVSFFEPQSFEAEQFKHLRTNILFPVTGKMPRSIMVTSAVPGEGKSFVASNLAVSIAQNIDQHVLLMDCDIRKPTIHSNFGFDETEGLCEYLSKDTS
ncbi:MAG: CpsD/CapB family tyrosine-protein kinase, partial [Desulfobacterales bacterium]|nr:CpsD/CapB family tyrosine-protein kinase [Deltaproteobacteria bacterium]NNL41091.1 CpsD/CapB family tyrosine-protein kinase [Desulfobacterales bacterium]